jgi:hypothetical protein
MARYRASFPLLTILATSVACSPVAAQTQVLGPISEETPPAVCWAGYFVTGIRCTGRYCDNIEITCTKIPGGRAQASVKWLPWVSEERPSTAWCGPGPNLIAGFACKGSYCDNISVYCVPLDALSVTDCWETRAVSEEQGGTLSFQEGHPGGIVVATQMSCSGSYCDNKTFYVCRIRSP